MSRNNCKHSPKEKGPFPGPLLELMIGLEPTTFCMASPAGAFLRYTQTRGAAFLQACQLAEVCSIVRCWAGDSPFSHLSHQAAYGSPKRTTVARPRRPQRRGERAHAIVNGERIDPARVLVGD